MTDQHQKIHKDELSKQFNGFTCGLSIDGDEWSDEKIEAEVSAIVNDYISDYMEMSLPLMEQTQPNFMPITFTLWRRVALKHLYSL